MDSRIRSLLPSKSSGTLGSVAAATVTNLMLPLGGAVGCQSEVRLESFKILDNPCVSPILLIEEIKLGCIYLEALNPAKERYVQTLALFNSRIQMKVFVLRCIYESLG